MANPNNVESQSTSEIKETKDLSTPPPTFAEAFRFWLKLGFISFGGPAGQISIMHQEWVDQQ